MDVDRKLRGCWPWSLGDEDAFVGAAGDFAVHEGVRAASTAPRGWRATFYRRQRPKTRRPQPRRAPARASRGASPPSGTRGLLPGVLPVVQHRVPARWHRPAHTRAGPPRPRLRNGRAPPDLVRRGLRLPPRPVRRGAPSAEKLPAEVRINRTPFVHGRWTETRDRNPETRERGPTKLTWSVSQTHWQVPRNVTRIAATRRVPARVGTSHPGRQN